MESTTSTKGQPWVKLENMTPAVLSQSNDSPHENLLAFKSLTAILLPHEGRSQQAPPPASRCYWSVQ